MMLSRLSLRAKLTALITVLQLASAAFLVIYLPSVFAGRARALVENRAQALADLVASAESTALEFNEDKGAADTLRLLDVDHEATYAVLLRRDGSRFAAWNPSNARVLGNPGTVGRLAYEDDQLHIVRPVLNTKEPGRQEGTLILGFSTATLQHERQSATQAVATVMLIVVLVGLIAAGLVGTLLVRPLRGMTDAALRIARGDLSQPDLAVGAKDEVGRMAEGFNRMLRALRDLAAAADRVARGDLSGKLDLEGEVAAAFNRMIEEQRRVVRQIADTSAQLASAAAEIYAASQEQEAAASHQSSGMEEVRSTMQSLLDAAAHISDSARGVLSNAERSRENTDSMAARIAELSGHTSRMTEILDAIRDIADRSDLLALNASLEATRAGEGGRAFSLVAIEMRRLAERVTQSVQDVKAMVSDVRASGSATVMATEEGRKLAEGTTVSARQITMVTQQQRTGTEQVNESLRDIATVLAQSVGAAQQTRSLAENLKHQADRLAETVGRFQLETPRAERG
jgi:methyl-accepting chemotaxis protein